MKKSRFDRLIDKTLDLLLPLPALKVSEYADANRFLSSEYAAEPGKWDTSRAEYQREIMDAFVDPRIEKIVCMLPAQFGKSAIVENVILFFTANDPKPILLVRPTQQDGENYSKERLAPLIRDTPVLRKILAESKSRNTGNTLTHKKFPGGYLAIVGANSPMDLASRPAPIVLMDERSRFPDSAGAEGDPGAIVEKRTSNFWNKKIGILSTPTNKGSCPTEREFLKSDQRYRHMRCPECNQLHLPKFEYLKYETEDTKDRRVVIEESVQYACPVCGVLLSSSHKEFMVREGAWVATYPLKKIAGFAASGLNSLWVSWAAIIQEYLDAVDDPNQYRTWVNTRLAEPFEEKGEAPEWERLYNRREFYPRGTVPRGGLLLVAAGDVQHDRIEVEIVAYGRSRESWSVDYIVIPGDTSQPEVWGELDKLLDREFEFENGYRSKIKRFGIDTGDGNRTAFIYLWARKHGPRKVMALKGSSVKSATQIISAPKKQDINYKGQRIESGVYLWVIGTNIVKSEFYSYLRLERPASGEPFPAGYCHFPDYSEQVFKMFVAEERRPRKLRNNITIFEWVCPPGKRNEALDTRVMARAVAESLGLSQWTPRHWDLLENIVKPSKNTVPVQAPTKGVPPTTRPVQQARKPYKPLGRPII